MATLPPDWTQPFRRDTARLTLFPCDGDGALALSLIQRDPRVHLPYYAEPIATARAPTDSWAQCQHDWERYGRFTLAARERDGGRVVGAVEFSTDGVSYFLDPACWGRGLGLEMVADSCAYMPALLGIDVLRARVLRENLRSRHLLERAGFAFAGLGSQAARGVATVAVLAYERPCR